MHSSSVLGGLRSLLTSLSKLSVLLLAAGGRHARLEAAFRATK